MGCFTNPGASFSKDGKRVGFFFNVFYFVLYGGWLGFPKMGKGLFFFFF